MLCPSIEKLDSCRRRDYIDMIVLCMLLKDGRKLSVTISIDVRKD